VTALRLHPFREGFRSQDLDELRELHVVVAALHAHVTVETGPYCIIMRPAAVPPQPSLSNKTGSELRLILGDRTYHGALAAVEAEVYLGILYLPFCIEHPSALSFPLMDGCSLSYIGDAVSRTLLCLNGDSRLHLFDLRDEARHLLHKAIAIAVGQVGNDQSLFP